MKTVAEMLPLIKFRHSNVQKGSINDCENKVTVTVIQTLVQQFLAKITADKRVACHHEQLYKCSNASRPKKRN